MQTTPIENSRFYIWPSGYYPPPAQYTEGTAVERKAIRQAIEIYFQNLFGGYVVLVPSGRAAISLILNVEKINRSHFVYAPSWSSQCVWNSIISFANPTIQLSSEIDVGIIVHKFGYVTRLDSPRPRIVIEDSCDSLFSSPEGLFSNQGDYEIISLPKVLGTYTGGLILTKNKSKYLELSTCTEEFLPIDRYQESLRYHETLGTHTPPENWESLEWQHYSLSYSSLLHIQEHMGGYDAHVDRVRKRFALLESKLPQILKKEPHRHPCHYVVPFDSKKSEVLSFLKVRHMDRNGSTSSPLWEPFRLIPLHLGLSDQDFMSIIRDKVFTTS